MQNKRNLTVKDIDNILKLLKQLKPTHKRKNHCVLIMKTHFDFAAEHFAEHISALEMATKELPRHLYKSFFDIREEVQLTNIKVKHFYKKLIEKYYYNAETKKWTRR